MIAYKQDNATVAKYPPKAATSAKHPPTKTTAVKYPPKRPLQQSIRRGNGHDTLGNKASAREEANDNGGKVSARRTITAKHPLREPDDDGKVNCCRRNHYE